MSKSKKEKQMQGDFILIDRSGSMSSMWAEALSSVNSYAKKLGEDKVDTYITVATFDANGGKPTFDVIRDRMEPKEWKPITDSDASPRGMTPLNDAIGKIVTLARKGHNGKDYDKAAVIIMTDGMENASTEYSHTAAKALLDDCRSKGWQVIFLGANFDNMAQATSYGNAVGATVAAAAGTMRATTTLMADKRASYGVSGQSMSFSAAEKAELLKKKK